MQDPMYLEISSESSVCYGTTLASLHRKSSVHEISGSLAVYTKCRVIVFADESLGKKQSSSWRDHRSCAAIIVFAGLELFQAFYLYVF